VRSGRGENFGSRIPRRQRTLGSLSEALQLLCHNRKHFERLARFTDSITEKHADVGFQFVAEVAAVWPSRHGIAVSGRSRILKHLKQYVMGDSGVA
jgi:hypothetical protein